jgi:hypothetical protein
MVNRYEPTVESTPGGPNARMVQRANGEWVRYADVVALEARIATLEDQARILAEDFERACGP